MDSNPIGRSDRHPFPRTAEEFESDPRVSYSKLDAKWILEEDDGSEWEWMERVGKWVPSLDESLLEQQQAAYGGATDDFEDDQHSAEDKNKNLKRKNGGSSNEVDQAKSKRQKSNASSGNQPQRKNSAVYVTNLPPDATVDEINTLFSRCGVIAEEIDSRAPRIKLYADPQGTLKGDALVVYFRPESVKLAIQLLDDTDFRFGVSRPEGTMRVKEADFSYKKVKDSGDGDGEKKGDHNTGNARERKKVIKKTQKMNSKLADWSSPSPSPPPAKLSRIVYLKPMFTLEELASDPQAMLDIKEDIREECSRLGEVTNVVLYDAEVEGVVSVRFREPESARACVRMMGGRMFGGNKVVAWVAEGGEKFKKTEKRAAIGTDDEDEENERLEGFGKWLEDDAAKEQKVDVKDGKGAAE